MTTPDPRAIAKRITVLGEMYLLHPSRCSDCFAFDEMIDAGLIEETEDGKYKRTELGDKVLLCIEGG